MLACMTFLALLALASLVESREVSCADNSCVAETGVALLQNHDHRSMKLNRVSSISQHGVALGKCQVYAEGADLTEKGYNLVKARCCFDGMSAFIARVAVDMKFAICGAGFAPGLALWHSCEGEGATRTFQDLKDAITQHSEDRCTALSKGKKECSERPTDCADYSGVAKPPGCDCKQSNFIDLDFKAKIVNNNLGGKGPDASGPPVIRYEKIGSSEGKEFDLVVEADDSFYDGNTAMNGNWEKTYGTISLKKGIKVDLSFTFVSTGTDDEVQLKDLAFTVYDLDGKVGGDGYEAVRASEYAGYITDDDTVLEVSRTSDGETRFANTQKVNICEEPCKYPADPMNLTPEQRSGAVVFYFKNVSSFIVSYAINPIDIPPKDFTSKMMFGGRSALIDHCAP